MAGVKFILIVTVFTCVNIHVGFCFIEQYTEKEMCGKQITLGNNKVYAAQINFDFLFQRNVKCRTKFNIPDSYSVAYRFLRANSYLTCNTTLKISTDTSSRLYRFCDIPNFPRKDVVLMSPRNLSFDFTSTTDPGRSTYLMLLYVFKTDRTCDQRSIRCKNGRCIDHLLFCNSKYNFCGDDTETGNCGSDVQQPESDVTIDKINVIGPICLGLFAFLLLIVLAYFCCRSTRIRNICGQQRSLRNQRARPLTARDVYIINVGDVGGTPEEGYDYVMDYKKYAAPPEYSSLENIAEAAERYTNLQRENTPGSAYDGVDGTAEGGNTNSGFEDIDDSELPKYDHVMQNSEEYNVNHNQL